MQAERAEDRAWKIVRSEPGPDLILKPGSTGSPIRALKKSCARSSWKHGTG